MAVLLTMILALGACAQADDTGTAGSDDIAVGTASETETATEAEDAGGVDDATAEPGDEDAADGADGDVGVAADPTFPLTGTLEIVSVEGGCLVLTVGDTQYEVLADPDADLAVDSANGVVVDATGDELARAGDEVTVEGSVDTGVSTFCQVGQPLFVTAVSPT